MKLENTTGYILYDWEHFRFIGEIVSNNYVRDMYMLEEGEWTFINRDTSDYWTDQCKSRQYWKTEVEMVGDMFCEFL